LHGDGAWSNVAVPETKDRTTGLSRKYVCLVQDRLRGGISAVDCETTLPGRTLAAVQINGITHVRPRSEARFEPPDACQSYAFMPLRTSHTFGLLGLGSDDPQRFFAGKGTLYLTRLGELASVATARYLPAD